MAHAIIPLEDCPHELELSVQIEHVTSELSDAFATETTCSVCAADECWLCLRCMTRFCSRYANGHMLDHFNENQDHCVVFSLLDSSCWCYQCDSYITSPRLHALRMKVSAVKFPEQSMSTAGAASSIDHDSPAADASSLDKLVDSLREGRFQNIAVLTGAGISVAAGIPDFRTPGTGLYAQVAKLGLPMPEAIFSLDFFENDPVPFSKVAKEFLLENAHIKPVNAHKFIKELNDRGQLMMNYTQNIDGLELKAGLPLQKLLQAHGHSRSARCYRCKHEVPIESFISACESEKALACQYCDGFVKPDIVFFGESLPDEFRRGFAAIRSADLVIVMGTSLKVYPFAFLVDSLPEEIPVVLINRENPGISRDKFLFLPGDIEDTVTDIMRGIGMDCI